MASPPLSGKSTPDVELIRRHQIEASLTLLENRNKLIPLLRLDTLRIAAISVGSSDRIPFQQMLGNYMKVDCYNLPEQFTSMDVDVIKSKLRNYNLIIAGIHSIPKGDFPVAWGLFINYLTQEKTSVITCFNQQEDFSRLKINNKPAGLIIAFQNDSLSQSLSAQLIFGGIGVHGKLLTDVGKLYHSGDGIVIEKPIRLKYTIPEEAGVNSTALSSAIDSIVNNALQKKAFPECNVLIALEGKVIFHQAYGYQTFENLTPARKDDLYDLASVTKVTGGLPAILKLYNEGKIDLDARVSSYFPDWKNRLFHPSNKTELTVRELYTHQSGLVPDIIFWKKTIRKGKLSPKWYRNHADEKHSLFVAAGIYLDNQFKKTVFRDIRKSPLITRGKYVYSDLPLVITPQIVKNISGIDFQEYVESEFYRPLGANEITYLPLLKFRREQIVPTENDNYYRMQQLQGTVHDESAAVMGGISGNAGVFASANDLAKLMQMYLQMGTYGGKQYVSESTMKEFTRVQFPQNNNRRGLIFDKPLLNNKSLKPADAYPCPEVSDESFGHSGYTGTFVWMDPKCNLMYIFLSNRVYPTRNNNLISDLNVRTDILSAIYKHMNSSGSQGIKPLIAVRSAAVTPEIITGAAQTDRYLQLLTGKRIGIVANQTSVIGKTSLIDSLKSLGVNIVKIFGPEHGFRGTASAGVVVADSIDTRTGIRIVSLYGRKSKPSRVDMADIDLMIFDIQDVGARFYTYINLLAKVMESCAENNKELLILDRPNPNGFSVDGPILEMKLKSGIGMFPIPITHGMTIGELAGMYNGEGWLANKLQCKVSVIQVANYSHDMEYVLPVAPSPNLNTQQSILLYPSLCLFEGTIISQGRGTYFPFTVLGNPDLKGKYPFSFTPVSIRGMSETPLLQNKTCYGIDLRNYNTSEIRKTGQINLKWLFEMYQAYPYKDKFFDSKQSKEMGNFDKLAGVTLLREQITAGKSEEEIRHSWEPALSEFRKLRIKYLLYP